MVGWMGTTEYILSRLSFRVSSRRAAEPGSLGPPSPSRCRREQDAGSLLTYLLYLLTSLQTAQAQARMMPR